MKFTKKSRCVMGGTHTHIAQHMLDYDYLCDRGPSVVAFFSAGGGKRSHKLYYGEKEIRIPTISSWEEIDELGEVDTLINLASFRSCSEVNKAALVSGKFAQIFTIAEGVAERETRELIALAKNYPKTTMFGPSIVGGLISEVFRIGHTGGSLENILASRLYRSGSVGIVSKSGGMMNELCRVVSKYTDGVHTALQVGGDRFPMTTFEDILTYYQSQEGIKMIVLLGEVGNRNELVVAEMIATGRISKPVVAWCLGGSAERFSSGIQFGHAGAQANSDEETAEWKNSKLAEGGAHVPDGYEDLGTMIGNVFQRVVGGETAHQVAITDEIEKKCLVIKQRRKTRFTSTISNEKGEELTYNSIPVSTFVQDHSLAKVIGHLRLKKELPAYACEFLTTSLILLADHGPAVSGAMNTIITARAGKDLVSSLIAGLTTIGPRFGGAIDGAATWLLDAIENNLSPEDVITHHKKSGSYIQGIGHKIKSKYNPDIRCDLLSRYATSFSSTRYLVFAKQVEELTLEKKPSLILNVDGHIAAILLDMLEDLGLTYEEKKVYVDAGLGNGIFVLARSIGFIGHYLDQQRLQEGLYRAPWEDILYEG